MGAFCSCIDKTLVATVPLYNDATRYGARTSALIPLEDQPHLLDLKLCEASVMTSHNSYIRTLQHLGEASTSALQVALDCGARCLELDIYRDRRIGSVFVAHGKEELPDDIITTTRLQLDTALGFLSQKAFERTNDPLFLALELLVHNEEGACNQIADLIVRHFGPRLYGGVLSGETRLRDLVGKVVLMSGGGAVGRLAPMIHTTWSDVFQNVPSSTPPETLRGAGTCIRVYPAGNLAGALSANYNPVPYLLYGSTFVALNVCTADEHMTDYIKWFAQSSFVKKVIRESIII